jgi:hypothetical protein
MTHADKIRENRLRRAAGRQGLRLVKSPRRDPRALDFGRYQLVAADKTVARDPAAYKLTLDEVERHLSRA